jgi:hypothetical protein
MAEILKEQFRNRHGKAWVRTHGVAHEGSALCSCEINPDAENVDVSIGQITCPDCIEVIKICHKIDTTELMPEYENELLSKSFNK